MLKVGVTGGIGSGKSFVCSVISAMGYHVYNSDEEAKKIVNNNPVVVNSIKKLFGEDIYVKGNLDRKKVAELVFTNRILLEKLNKIVHPEVKRHFDNWLKINSQHRIIFQEAAIIFESGANNYLDKVIGVIAPLETRIRRIKERDGVNKKSILNRIGNQISDNELIQKCDYLIYNNDKELIVPQIQAITEKLTLETDK